MSEPTTDTPIEYTSRRGLLLELYRSVEISNIQSLQGYPVLTEHKRQIRLREKFEKLPVEEPPSV